MKNLLAQPLVPVKPSVRDVCHCLRRAAFTLGALLGGTELVAGQYLGAPAVYANGAQPLRNPVLRDVSGDGILDIITANSYGNSITVHLGLGGGAFDQGTDYATAATATTVDGPTDFLVLDVNNDQLLDVVTLNSLFGSNSGVSILLGSGGGQFGVSTTYVSGSSGGAGLGAGDVSGDGLVDIVTISYASTSMQSLMMIPGLAGGGFGPAAFYTLPATGALMADVNGDGISDALTTDNTLTVTLGLASGGFGPPLRAQWSTPSNSAMGDVNNDGLMDRVGNINPAGTFFVYLGLPGGGFGAGSPYATEPATSNSIPYGIALGDITADGRLDVVTVHFGNQHVVVVPGLGNSSFGPYSVYPTGAPWGPIKVAVADLNGDGRADVVVTGLRNIYVHLNQATPTATSRATLAGISLLPNPAHGSATVQLPALSDAATLTLLDALGRTLRTETLALPATGLRHELNLTGVPPGIYTLRVQAGEATAVRRLVVE